MIRITVEEATDIGDGSLDLACQAGDHWLTINTDLPGVMVEMSLFLLKELTP